MPLRLNLGKVGIAHRGGGADCAIGAGVIQGLTEEGVFDRDFAYAQGVSGGALNIASLIASLQRGLGRKVANSLIEGYLSLAKDARGDAALFQRITLSGVRKIPSTCSDAGLRELIYGVKSKYVNRLPLDAASIVASPIHFDVIIRKEIGRRRIQEIVSNHDEAIKKSPEKLLAYIQASASIAPFFPPVKIDKNFYSDGLSLRLKPPFSHGCETIFLIVNDHTHFANDCEVVMDWHERAAFPHGDCNDDVLDLRLRYIRDDIHRGKILQISKMGSDLPFLDKAANVENPQPIMDDDGHLVPRIIVIGPTKWIKGLSATSFTRAGIENGIEHGRERAKAVLAALSEK